VSFFVICLSHDNFSKQNSSLFFRLANGGEFLLQAHDDSEMQQWVGSLKAQCDQTGAESRSQTLPASSQKDEPKRRSFFTLKKK
jgi:spectrin beta